MNIRIMREDDVPYVAQIEREAFSLPWSAEAFSTAVKDKNALFLVAEKCPADSSMEEVLAVAGYIGMYVSVPEGEITNVAVAAGLRGRGCGAGLVRAMQQRAAAFGVNRIFLEVRESNAAAIHVYNAAGFETIGRRRGFYELPREDALVMRWNKE